MAILDPAPKVQENRTGPSPGDIVLFEHPKGIAQIIPLITGSPYYHVALYAGEDKVLEARPQGVMERDQHDPIGGPFDAFIPMPRNTAEHALAWARTKIGDKYDRLGLVVMILEHVFRHLHLNYAPSGRFTCGEFVCLAFREAGAELFPGRDPESIEPGDFAALHPVHI